MLQHLHIENYALIKQTDIDFAPGFVVITGETGAGKTILLGALGLLLGQRADLQALGDKGRKCVVEAQFGIAGLGLESLLAEADVDYDDSLIVRREILPSGKSRAFVGDTPAQLPLLKQLGERLIDIHSQHQTLTLGNGTFQTSLLDNIAHSPVEAYAAVFADYAALKKKLEELTAADSRNKKEMDYLRFNFDELVAARLRDGEQEELEQEQQLLAHTEAIKEALGMVATLCDADEHSAIPLLGQAKSALSRMTDFHDDIRVLHERIDSSLIELRDIMADVEHLDSKLAFSPERLQEIDERLNLIYRLERKHDTDSVAGLLQVQNDLDRQLQNIDDTDHLIEQTMEAVDKAFAKVQSAAEALTSCRTAAATKLENDILIPLSKLGMGNARLEVNIATADHYGPMGHDDVTFLFSANRGHAPRELSKVASGGEMSRLMLAIKSLVADSSLLPTVVFDEIDTGVSGDISVAVAGLMSAMAGKMQVVAITHLPQIAARAGQHLKVYKEVDAEGVTVSRLRELAVPERLREVAIMLSSDPPTEAALQTAKELMQ
ncbi:MAG: DNA repair protein RecN [Bacteroidales bacterium]|nr:DNA repair protein RecN [Bacteroidales bacterium]